MRTESSRSALQTARSLADRWTQYLLGDSDEQDPRSHSWKRKRGQEYPQQQLRAQAR